MGYALSAAYAELYEEYLAYEKPRVSRQGYAALAGCARRVLRWFDAEELTPEDVTLSQAARYQAEVAGMVTKEGEPLSTGTVCNYLKAARKFFGYLVLAEKISTNPFAELRYPRSPEHLSRNSLTEAQMGRLLSELSRFDEGQPLRERLRRYRTHVLAEFLYSTGLRIAEACSLTAANVDTRARLVYVPSGKGGKARTAFLTGYAADVMERYLARGRKAVLGRYPRKHGDTLFGADKARVASVVNGELARVCGALGLPAITSHGFRHSLGTHLLRSGCDMRHIQAILGHESLATTQVYTRVDKDDLRKSLDEHHPRRWPRTRVPA